MCDFVDSKAAANKISRLLIDNSLSLVPLVLPRNKKHSKGLRYVKLPGDIKDASSVWKTAFDSWKKHDFPSGGDTHDTYRYTHKEYRLLLHNFLTFPFPSLFVPTPFTKGVGQTPCYLKNHCPHELEIL